MDSIPNKEPFSEIVKSIPAARHFETAVINHPLYDEIANGTLPEERFKAFIQQFDLYVDNKICCLRLLLENMESLHDVDFLESLLNRDWNSFFQTLHDGHGFGKATEMVPTTLAYSVFQLEVSKDGNVALAFATFYASYVLWHKIGERMSELAELSNNQLHKYRDFIEAYVSVSSSELLRCFSQLVNDYYANLPSAALKQKMLEFYTQSVQHEFFCAQANYTITPVEMPNQPLKFTDLYDTFTAVSLQKQFMANELWIGIAGGRLPLQSYTNFLQQDLVYILGFYEAWKTLEEKESDPDRRTLLTKNPETVLTWFQEQYEKDGIVPTTFLEFYTQAYMDHIQNTAKNSSIAEGLASLYPCYVLWSRMGLMINQTSHAETDVNHPYRDFILKSQPGPNGNKSLEKMQNTLNGYYHRLGSDIKSKLGAHIAAGRSTMLEVIFANGVQTLGRQVVGT